ncbi:hypothetical protein AB0O64_36775 [Streptomyces sp. NPDC088341]|uniref:hypothetical protein n=1 Tax=Streptomyces sp. NPDC088341 TaxID=3154870 RepID=UPI00343CE6C6
MHDHAGTPDPDHREPGHPDAGRQGIGHDTALEKIRAVAGWYRAEITRERYTGTDGARLLGLIAALRTCTRDQQTLEEAGPEEAARIAAEYETRYTELTKE